MNLPAQESTQKVGSFLTVEKDGSLTIELHQSWVESYMLCPAKFWLQYGEPSLELSAAKPALSFGTAVHAAMAARYTAQPLAAQENEIIKHFTANPAEDGEPRSPGRAIEALRAYDATYPTEDWEVLAVEEEFVHTLGPFTATMHNFQGRPFRDVTVRIAGRKDLVVKWHNSVWVVDHKTGSEFGQSVIDNDHRSFQAKLYLWHERQKRPTENVAGFLFNHIVCRSLTSKQPHTFHREPVVHSDVALALWREKTLLLAKEVVERWSANQWPEYETACSHWGRCPFYDLCTEEPGRRAPLLASGLWRKRDPKPLNT